MSHLDLTDREIERVLAGNQPPGRDDLAELAFLMARLRRTRDFEQAPPMSPRLLAELDAAEVQHRPSVGSTTGRFRVADAGEADTAWSGGGPERREGRRPYRPAHARRASVVRRRWRVVGAAAAAILVVGLLGLAAFDTERPVETAVSEAPEDDRRPSSTETSATPVTTTTTMPITTTTAPPTTQPRTTTTATAPPSTSASLPPPESVTTSDTPWPGNMSPEELHEWLEDNCERRRDPPDWCEYYEDYQDDDRQDSRP